MRFPYLLAAAVVVAAACPRAAGAQVEPIDQAAAGTWSYAGPTGPAFWATRLGYAECLGPRQSPVDLQTTTLSHPLFIRLTYPRANQARLVNTGHTVNLLLEEAATLQVADTTFDYKETHFHVPAEHLVHGRRHAAEIHTVHQQGNGSRAVLTTFIVEGDHNDHWNSLVDGLPGNRDDQNQIGVIDLIALLSAGGLIGERIYSYAGSLTTPQCTPNVRFLIRERAITLSRQQIDALASAFARNVRPIFSVTTQVTLHGFP